MDGWVRARCVPWPALGKDRCRVYFTELLPTNLIASASSAALMISKAWASLKCFMGVLDHSGPSVEE